jgi:Zn-dependent M32 family carboxypeptidase
MRNEADELTKIFHDLLRYRIEKDLINGKLNVKGPTR